MQAVRVNTSTRKYNIFLGEGILDDAHSLIIKYLNSFDKTILITNKTIDSIYGDRIRVLCGKLKKDYKIICLEDGEEYKSLNTVKSVYSELIKYNFHRNDIIIAFGGGVIGDTAGYIASTFHRGLKLVHIPTTIIAQVDSSIGGKVAVNFKNYKNIIGSFYQPHIIITDTSLLDSLDVKQILNGLGEIVKYGLVFDKQLLNSLLRIIKSKGYWLEDLAGYDGFSDIILKCIKIKAKVVQKDEFDRDYRNLLNFGHTIGHSIENVAGLKSISHGQGVSMGILVANEISWTMGFLPYRHKVWMVNLFRELGLPVSIPEMDADMIFNGLKYDKKATSHSNRFILLKGINKPFFHNEVTKDVILGSINNCINK